jgi:two-component system, OmpR family, alkaline phosphatase synthesis response regulator PhoP
MNERRILVVDDEKDIAELLRVNLERAGFATDTVHTGEEALEQAFASPPDLVVLDLMLPGLDGIAVCERLKQEERTANVPVLMLTAKAEDAEVVAGLESGADDYVTKPFSPKVVVARINTLLRRKTHAETNTGEVLSLHGIRIDVSRHEVYIENEMVNLSATEFSILEFLARNAGWVFSRNQIIDAVKGKDYPVTERSVDVQILGLRKKLGTKGVLIQTVRGVGYRLQAG